MSATSSQPRYRRILLKVSGEGLAGDDGFGIAAEKLRYVVEQIGQVHAAGVQVAIVIGGGNILRGGKFVKEVNIPTAVAHHMGMLATIINALALREAFESAGIPARALSALPVHSVCDHYDRRHALEHLQAGRVVILAGGTGRPFVTTDTAAALGAAELEVDALCKVTQVDGVYSADPHKVPDAELFASLSYDEVLSRRLGVMDLAAFELCRAANIPIVVFNMHQPGNMKKLIDGESIGTVISNA